MRKKNFKGRCEKRVLGKCAEVCRTYDAIQYAYADLLQASDEIKEIRCNVLLDGLEVGEYTSDFVCTKADGDLMVRECVYRKFLMKPLTVKLLDALLSWSGAPFRLGGAKIPCRWSCWSGVCNRINHNALRHK